MFLRKKRTSELLHTSTASGFLTLSPGRKAEGQPPAEQVLHAGQGRREREPVCAPAGGRADRDLDRVRRRAPLRLAGDADAEF